MKYNVNGILAKGKNLGVTIDNRGLNYGDGVFETLKFAHNRINFWEDHYFRLMSSMRILRMEIPMSFSPEYLEEQIRKTIDANGWLNNAVRVKLLVVRKPGGYYTPTNQDVDFLITVDKLEEATYTLNEHGVKVDLFKDFYKQKSMLSNLKLGATPLFTVASIFRKENQLDECLLVNDQKSLVEAISANVFLVKGRVVYTPALESGCLKGIMRKNVLEILQKMDWEIIEKEEISPFELQKADEVFLTNSIKGIQWVSQYRKKQFTHELSDELLKRINVAVALN